MISTRRKLDVGPAGGSGLSSASSSLAPSRSHSLARSNLFQARAATVTVTVLLLKDTGERALELSSRKSLPVRPLCHCGARQGNFLKMHRDCRILRVCRPF